MKWKGLGAWTERLRGMLEKYKFVLLVILAGIALLLLPPSGGRETEQDLSGDTGETLFRVEELEEKLEDALSRVEGAGEVEVVLTLKSSARQILAQDTRRDDGSLQQDTVVVSAGSGSQEAVALQQLSPQYQGALVVCSGGDDPAVRLRLADAVSDLTGLGTDRISVCKGK